MHPLVMMSEFVRASNRIFCPVKVDQNLWKGLFGALLLCFLPLYVNNLIIQKMHLCCVHLSDVLLLEVNRSFHSIISKDCKAMEFMKRVGQCGLVLVLNVALV